MLIKVYRLRNYIVEKQMLQDRSRKKMETMTSTDSGEDVECPKLHSSAMIVEYFYIVSLYILIFVLNLGN